MATSLSVNYLTAIIEHACSSPDEVCGVLIGQRDPLRVAQIVAARNVHGQPQQHYLLDAASLLHADDLARSTGQQIVGFYHSHPRGAAVPSPHDLLDVWPGYMYLIAAFAHGTPYVCAWLVDDRRTTQSSAFPYVLRYARLWRMRNGLLHGIKDER